MMTANKQYILTYEGLKEREEELEYLKSVRRAEVAETIKQARAYGDLSENSEYDEAKDEQAKLEIRIATLENLLKNVKIIDEDDIDTNTVNVGSKVKVHAIETGDSSIYAIVGSTEADPLGGKISDESPIGRALIGHKVGDKVSISVPIGTITMEIIEITK